MEAIVTAFVWYLVVSAPQGGLVVMPSGFDTAMAMPGCGRAVRTS